MGREQDAINRAYERDKHLRADDFCAGCGMVRDKLRKCDHCGKMFCTVVWPGMTCGAIHRDRVKRDSALTGG